MIAHQAGPDGAGREHEDPVVGRDGGAGGVDIGQAQRSGPWMVPCIR